MPLPSYLTVKLMMIMVGPDGVFKGKLRSFEWLYGGTSHFKGLHDGEGGAAKGFLGRAVRERQVRRACHCPVNILLRRIYHGQANAYMEP